MSELERYQEMKRGSQAAFEFLFKLHYESLVKYACKKGFDPSVAEDIVQNVFIEFWTKRKKWNIETSVAAYLKKTVNSRCIDYFRREKNIQARQEVFFKDNLFLDVSSPESELLTQENLQAIHEKIEALPPKCKIVFKLSRFDQKTYAEIVEELGISPKTVEFHISSALRLLRKSIFTTYLIIIIAHFY